MPDPKLDQLMLDLKQQADLAKEASTEIQSQRSEYEALASVFKDLDKQSRAILATQTNIGQELENIVKKSKDFSSTLDKIPAVAKTIDSIQKTTGKSYSESLKTLKDIVDKSKKHTEEAKATKSAVESLEKAYKKTVEDIDKGHKSLKDFGKTQKEIDAQRTKSMERQLVLIKEYSAHVRSMLGGAGASGPGGFAQGAWGMAKTAGTHAGDSYIDRRVKSGKMSEEQGKQAHIRFGKIGVIIDSIMSNTIDAYMYEVQKNVKMQQAGFRLGRFGGAKIGGKDLYESNRYISREEAIKASEQTRGLGIIPNTVKGAQQEMREFAANSKLYGDEINTNITEKMITASGSVEKSWKHINELANAFRDIAKEAGVPMQDLMKWTAETAVQARFLNIDAKIVEQTYSGLTKNLKGLQTVGITRADLGGIGKNFMTTMGKADLPMRAFWGARAGITGSTDEIIQKVSMSGRYMRRTAGGGYETAGKDDPTLSLRVLKEMQKTMWGLGYTGSVVAAKSGLFPGFGEKDVRALMRGDFSKLTEKVTEGGRKSSAEYLEQLVQFEIYKQKWMDKVAQIWTGSGGKTMIPATGEVIDYAKELWKKYVPDKPKKKHIGGVIPKGTVSEVLTDESFRSLGKDSFYAFNPSQDVMIGSPQTTKTGQNRSRNAGNDNQKNVFVNIVVNGSIMADHDFLSKIEETFARNRGLI